MLWQILTGLTLVIISYCTRANNIICQLYFNLRKPKTSFRNLMYCSGNHKVKDLGAIHEVPDSSLLCLYLMIVYILEIIIKAWHWLMWVWSKILSASPVSEFLGNTEHSSLGLPTDSSCDLIEVTQFFHINNKNRSTIMTTTNITMS